MPVPAKVAPGEAGIRSKWWKVPADVGVASGDSALLYSASRMSRDCFRRAAVDDAAAPASVADMPCAAPARFLLAGTGPMASTAVPATTPPRSALRSAGALLPALLAVLAGTEDDAWAPPPCSLPVSKENDTFLPAPPPGLCRRGLCREGLCRRGLPGSSPLPPPPPPSTVIRLSFSSMSNIGLFRRTLFIRSPRRPWSWNLSSKT